MDSQRNPYQSPEPIEAGSPTYVPANSGQGLIPYKNPKALTAYYLGLVSGLPGIGLPLGIVAFVLGIQGLQARKRNPEIKGSVHAWIGIGCGGFFALFWLLMISGMILFALLDG